ncbi:hypothetical protein D3C81_886170 [compost metagenome]
MSPIRLCCITEWTVQSRPETETPLLASRQPHNNDLIGMRREGFAGVLNATDRIRNGNDSGRQIQFPAVMFAAQLTVIHQDVQITER